MKIKVISAILIASFGSIIPGLHAQDISVTITPPSDLIVPAAGVQVTADATPANGADGACITFDWADPDGDWGTGSVTGLESVLSYYPEGDLYGTDDDVTCTVTDGVGDTDMDDVDLYVPLITTTTEQSSTSPDSRTTIGIGEEVDCAIKPDDLPGASSTVWTNSGSGTFSTPTGSSTTYSAYSNAESDTLTATLSDSSTSTVTLNVILPTTNTQPMDYVTRTAAHPTIGVEFYTYDYMGPDTVNFYNCGFHEGTCSATGTGYFSYTNGFVHNPGSAVAALDTSVVSGWGTYVFAMDDVKVVTIGTPYSSPGNFNWPIPDYWVLNGIQNTFTTTNETAVMNYSGSEYSETLSKSIANATSNNYP